MHFSAVEGSIAECPCSGLFLPRGIHISGSQCQYLALLAVGCSEVVELLLRAGANPAMMNNLGKTAGNMAAFVGELCPSPLPLNYLNVLWVLA